MYNNQLIVYKIIIILFSTCRFMHNYIYNCLCCPLNVIVDTVASLHVYIYKLPTLKL